MRPGALLRDATADRPARCLFLLTAVLAAGVPSCLIAGCGGNAAAGAAVTAQVPGPAVSAGPARAAAAAVRKRSSPLAMSLMTKAAQAVVLRSYRGQELVSSWDVGGVFEIADISHVGGGDTIVATQARAAGSQPFMSADLDNQSREGVLGVTVPLVGLLEEHYVVGYGGTSSADSRPARVVEAWRPDGSLAARFWLDTATGLPLEREVFDPAAHEISDGLFVISSGTAAVASKTPLKPEPSGAPLTPDQLTVRGGEGWQVPAGLPGGLTLFAGYETAAPNGPVLDLGYSDGLYVVSLFEQRGNMGPVLAGWQRSTVGGRAVYTAEPSQRLVAWTGHGLVYTVVADAPAQTLAAVVRGLPHDSPPGFLKRISRGLTRLARLVNPFG